MPRKASRIARRRSGSLVRRTERAGGRHQTRPTWKRHFRKVRTNTRYVPEHDPDPPALPPRDIADRRHRTPASVPPTPDLGKHSLTQGGRARAGRGAGGACGAGSEPGTPGCPGGTAEPAIAQWKPRSSSVRAIVEWRRPQAARRTGGERRHCFRTRRLGFGRPRGPASVRGATSGSAAAPHGV